MNKNVFKSQVSGVRVVPVTDAVNAAGGSAYKMEDEQALATLACTGCFNDTFYTSAEDQVKLTLDLARKVNPEFLAKVAVYARESAFMKDSAALLLGVLFTRDVNLFKQVFNRVVTNGKMLKNFCQVIRSGVVGRKSFGSAGKKAIEQWLAGRTDKQLLEDSVGTEPSLADVVKMVHPRPVDNQRDAYYAWLLGKSEFNKASLPSLIRDFEAFKVAPKDSRVVPHAVPFQMLTALDLSTAEWVEIAKTAKWHMTRMNLNTFERHGVFKVSGMTEIVASRLKDAESIKHASVFPYQLFAAYKHADASLPMPVTNALQDAMEVATENVPSFQGKVLVAVDCSGSMAGASVTGNRGSVTSKINCNEVASLIAACVVRKSTDVRVMKFDTSATNIKLNPRDSVMTNITKIGFHGGGTDCGSPLRLMNQNKDNADIVIIVSDNESWCNDSYGRGTSLQNEWQTFKRHNPKAKMVCIDLAASATTQAKSGSDILNIGGFSDTVFQVISGFLEASGGADHWTNKIKSEIKL